MLVFCNTECPNCGEKAGFVRIKRSWVERNLTHRHDQKAHCAGCQHELFLTPPKKQKSLG